MDNYITIYRGITNFTKVDLKNPGKYWAINVETIFERAGFKSDCKNGLIIAASIPKNSKEILAETNKAYPNLIDLGWISSIDYDRYYHCDKTGEPYLDRLTNAEVIVINPDSYNQLIDIKEFAWKIK